MTSKNAVLAAALVSIGLAACGSQLPGGSGPGAFPADAGTPIAFVPSAVRANRFPTVCGVANPPLAAGDLYTLDIIGAMTAAPYNMLEVSFTSPMPPAGTPIELSVMALDPQGIGVSDVPTGQTTWYAFQYAASGGVKFVYEQGSNPGEIDTGAYDAVFVTPVSLPIKDGEPFAVRLQIHFLDANILDQVFSGSLVTAGSSGCPAG